jgi:ABC-type transporter Mla subunit MlaD
VTHAADHLAPYRELVELAQNECAMVQAGHIDELARIQDDWNAVLRTLPANPPADAEALIRHALALTAQTELAIQAGMVQLQQEMGEADRTRTVGRAYSPAAAMATSHRVDTAA